MGIAPHAGAGGLTNTKLSLANAVESDVISGKKFYAKNKELKTGTMHNNGRWPDAEKFTLEGDKIWMYQKQNGYLEGGLGSSAYQLGNAQAEHVLSGVSASSASGIGFSGTMTNRGTWVNTIDPGKWVYIPQGYHNGNGWVQARGVNVDDVKSLINVKNVPSPTASIYRPNEYILGLDKIGEMTGTTGNKWLAVISDDHHTISFTDGTPSWFNYVYIQL